MNALKRITVNTTTVAISGLLLMGFYNSVQMNSDAFMQTSTDIRFVKRLDEIKGTITIGRMAASAIKWESLSSKKYKNKTKDILTLAAAASAKNVQKVAASSSVEQKKDVPEPAISDDLDMNLSKAFFKKPLKPGSYSGSAKTVDGVIEEIYVSLPNGRNIEINTRDRMVGNVFQYEDTQTRELKSGMFYEVKKGTYMITLTNDSQYAGMRLEFKAENNASVAYDVDYNEGINWGMNTQNSYEELTKEDLPTQQNDNVNKYNDLEYSQSDVQENSTYGFQFSS
jgi:hypothetical protein